MKSIRTETNELGCELVVSHKLNADGYFRKNVNGKLVMYHRHVYGEDVPEGYEIHHTCGNRACINKEHLELVKREDHLLHSNINRYKTRRAAALGFWLEFPEVSGSELGRIFGVSWSSACGWVRSWK